MERAELLRQLAISNALVGLNLLRANPDDRLAFTEFSAAMREMADLADKLAAPEEPQS